MDRGILRLEMALSSVVFISRSPTSPIYADNNRGQDNINGIGEKLDADLNEKPPFPRSPTKRLRWSNNGSSQIDLSKRPLVQEDEGRLLPHTKGGDEGYESDESARRSPSRRSPAMDSHRAEKITEQSTCFANATIGIDTPGLALPISQGKLNAPQVHFLRRALITSASTIPIALELPDTYTTQQTGPDFA